MADTRINALSTATSSASDDFVPIDGTTNGTRKLSAYSPSFGGNATVGGTLTVSGMTTSNGYKTPGGGYSLQFGTSDTNTRITGDNGASADSYLKFYTSGALALQVDVNSQVQVKATTASLGTSSGALVVSGGVGVAGNAYVGGKLVVSGGVENTISGNVEFSTGQIRVTNAYTPLSASAAGAVGSITWDNLYIYVCVATNTWKRVAISSW